MDNLFNIYAQFNDRANEIYRAVYSEFSHEASNFKRKGSENRYQLQIAQYLVKLKQGLEETASGLINECKDPSLRDKLQFGLPARIDLFIKEFMQKAEAL